jgi:uncharacterized membrane protein
MPTPPLVLLTSFWLHMLATVVWIGGLAALAVLIIPVARRSLEPQDFSEFLRKINQKLEPIGWLSLGVLTVTGLVQMGANPDYEGFFAFHNNWARAILFKHLIFLGMIAVSAYLTWGLNPAIQRAAIQRARGRESSDEQTLERRVIRLMYLNLALAILILILTALARIS